eukprot:m.128924 g.128924  ORF g.128924 m.128924 type:complete len:185 (-) comp29360_c0_seq2:1330-1884(-)
MCVCAGMFFASVPVYVSGSGSVSVSVPVSVCLSHSLTQMLPLSLFPLSLFNHHGAVEATQLPSILQYSREYNIEMSGIPKIRPYQKTMLPARVPLKTSLAKKTFIGSCDTWKSENHGRIMPRHTMKMASCSTMETPNVMIIALVRLRLRWTMSSTYTCRKRNSWIGRFHMRANSSKVVLFHHGS